ncbi:MAG TPA: 2-amino-3,7-dideoxy-D-threo-hept-6-ulosonate synthase [Thermoplasmata archaeon]|nr:2-amino-3,7-dideoxy-D-threo-hept-6-ulosonate synthase [Thermoplasmata archaeon]
MLRNRMEESVTSIGKEIRLRRVLVGGRALIVAMDHGVSSGPVPGLEDIRKAVANVAKGGATSVVLHKGAVRFAKDYFDEKLSLILHLSASTSVSVRPDRKVRVTDVEEAIGYGADAISVHVNLGGEDDDRMLEDLGATAGACERLGMPLLAMMYPRGPNVKNPYDVDVVKHVARVGAELGADVVKTLYTGTPETFKEVVQGCPVPVVVAGGTKLDSPRAALEMVAGALAGGAAGVSMGRNIFQSKDPIGTTRAIARMIFDGASIDEVYRG